MVSIQKPSLYSLEYTFKFPRRQKFSLPESFLHYISQNGAVYEKLIQTCKYFFARHHLVPMASFYFGESENEELTWDFNKATCHLFNDKTNIDLKKSKLWIYDSFTCADDSSTDIFSSFFKSVHRCTLTSLKLWYQAIDGYKFSKILANVKYIDIHNYTTFSFPGKTEASLWDILTLMPKLEHCHICCKNENCLSLSTKDITMPVLPFLKDFYFLRAPKDDFPGIAKFIKLHLKTKFEIFIKEGTNEIDVKAFKRMLKKTFPDASITLNEYDALCEFQLSLESQQIQVELS